MNPIDKVNRINQLFDAYGVLLTDKQQEILVLYYDEDFSLAEIATQMQISRAAVLDHLRRSEKILENYEKKLKLVQHTITRSNIYGKIREYGYSEVNHWIEVLETLDI